MPVAQAAALAGDFGHEVAEAAPVIDYAQLRAAMITIVAANMADTLAAGNPLRPEGARAEDVETMTWRFAERGDETSATAYLRALRDIRAVGQSLADFFERYDVLLLPTLGRVAVPLDETEPSASERRLLRVLVSPAAAGLFRVPGVREGVLEAQMEIAARQAMQRTMVANLTGIPAISVPAQRTENDLPVGVQFLGRYGDEKTLLRLAAQLEQANPWRVRI